MMCLHHGQALLDERADRQFNEVSRSYVMVIFLRVELYLATPRLYGSEAKVVLGRRLEVRMKEKEDIGISKE